MHCLCCTGDHRPCCTTLLAFFWHAGALWAIPDLPAADTGSRRADKAAAAGYKLLRLCLDSKRWQQVPCQVGTLLILLACCRHHITSRA